MVRLLFGCSVIRNVCCAPAAMLFVVYALCMYALYSLMPVVVKLTSATAVNLSLLTADLFSLFCGLFLFGHKVRAAQARTINLDVSGVERFITKEHAVSSLLNTLIATLASPSMVKRLM